MFVDIRADPASRRVSETRLEDCAHELRGHRAPAPPPDLLRALPRVDDARRRPPRPAGLRAERSRDAPGAVEGIPARAAGAGPAARLAARRGAGHGRARRPERGAGGTSTWRGWRACCSSRPVSSAWRERDRRRRFCSARRARPAGASRSSSTSPPAGSTASPTASTGTTRSRTRCSGRAAAGRRGHDAGGDGRPLAHRLALRRARLPAPLLGRGHDARAGDRGRGERRARAAAAQRFPDAAGHPAGRRGRRPRVPARPARRWATASRRSAGRRGGERRGRRARPLEFPLVTRAQHAGDGDAPRRPVAGRRPARRGAAAVRRPRRGHPAPRLHAPHGSGRDGAARAARLVARRLAPRRAGAALRRRPRGGGHGARGLPLADAGRPMRPGDLRGELLFVCLDQDLAGTPPSSSSRAVDARRARRPRLPRGPARGRPGRGSPAPRRLRARHRRFRA